MRRSTLSGTSKASPPPVKLSRDELFTELELAWAALDHMGATVSRVPKDFPMDLLSVKLRHEQRRIRAMKERG